MEQNQNPNQIQQQASQNFQYNTDQGYPNQPNQNQYYQAAQNYQNQADQSYQGYQNQADQNYQGYQNQADQNCQAYQNQADQNYQGYQNQADQNYQAYQNQANQNYQGYQNQANQNYQAYQNQANQNYQAYQNQADQNYQGYQNQADQSYQGYQNQANQNYNHAQGYQNQAQGYQNQVQGYQNQAQGYQNQAQGYQNQAQGYQNQAQGYQNQANQNYQGYQQPVYAGESKAVKKKINPAVIIIPVVIVLLAAAAVVAYLFLFGKTSYQDAEKNYFSGIFNSLSSTAEDAAENYQPQSVEISFDASNSQVAEYIEEYIGVSNISFTMDSAKSGDDFYSKAAVLLGDKNISGEFWYGSDHIAAVFPDISSIYLLCDISEEDVSESDYTYDVIMQVFGELISETSDKYFEVIGEPELIKNQEVYVNGYTLTADKAEISLSYKEVATIVVEFLENLKENDKALDIIAEYSGNDKEYILSELNEAIDGCKETIETASDTEELLKMNVYISGGTVVGREVSIVKDGVENDLLKLYQFNSDGSDIVSLSIITDEEYVELRSVDTASGDVHNGTLTLTANDESITVTYGDLAVTDKLFQGTVSAYIESQPAFEVSVALNTEGNTKTAVVTIPNICTLTVSIKPSTLSYKELPQLNEGEYLNLYDYSEYDPAYEQLSEDLTNFIWNLMYDEDYVWNDDYLDLNDFSDYLDDDTDNTNNVSDDNTGNVSNTDDNSNIIGGNPGGNAGTAVSDDAPIIGLWTINTMGSDEYEISVDDILEIYGESYVFNWSFEFKNDGTVNELYSDGDYGYNDEYIYEFDGKTVTVLYPYGDIVEYTMTYDADNDVLIYIDSDVTCKFVR